MIALKFSQCLTFAFMAFSVSASARSHSKHYLEAAFDCDGGSAIRLVKNDHQQARTLWRSLSSKPTVVAFALTDSQPDRVSLVISNRFGHPETFADKI
jgi:hypothetical protein